MRILRTITYGLTAIAQSSSAYALSKGLIGADEVTLINGIGSAILVMAGVKALNPDSPVSGSQTALPGPEISTSSASGDLLPGDLPPGRL